MPLEQGNFPLEPEKILQQLYAIATCNVADALQVKDGTLQVRDTCQLSHSQQQAIAAMEKTSGGIKIKFHDKLKALELLGKHMGLFESAVTLQSHDTGVVEALLNRTKGVLDIHDIPELQQTAADRHDLVEQTSPEGA